MGQGAPTLLAYKLLRRRKDGTLGPLFINASQRIPLGEWLIAESHKTKGFAFRPGWHCTVEPVAPHLVMNPKGQLPRVWCRVEISDWKTIERPASQGEWLLAKEMRVMEILE